jgi:iron(III) transport system permease protein
MLSKGGTLSLGSALTRNLRHSGAGLQPWLFVLTAGALLYLVVPPVLFILSTSFVSEIGPDAGSFTLRHYRNIFGSLSDLTRLLWNSLVFSGGSATVALLLGTTVAWLAERTNAPFRSFAYAFAFISFGVPGIVKVIGWILLLGPRAGLINVAVRDMTGVFPVFDLFSMTGMVLVEAVVWSPVVFLLMATPFRSMDPTLEEAGMVAGSSNWQVFTRVTVPLATPSVLAVLLLTVVRAIESFETPALVGLPAGVEVLTTKIYLRIKSGYFPRYGEASAYSIILIGLVALGLIFYHRRTAHGHKFTTVTGKGYRPRRIDLGRWRWPAGLLLLTLPALQVAPLVALVWASVLPYMQHPSSTAFGLVSLNNYFVTLNDPTIVLAVRNSLTISLTAASVTVLITFIAAWLIVRTNIPGRWALDQLAMFPLVLPGLVLGVAILKLYAALPLPIYGTIWIMFFAFVVSFLPYGMRFSYTGLLSIHRELEESSTTCGGNWGQTIIRILVPLMLPALFAGWIFIFLITIRHLSLPLLLYGPGSQVISVTIWELWDNGRIGEVAAFSLLTTTGTVLLAIIFQRLSQRFALEV